MLRHLHVFVPTLSIVTTLLIAEIFSLRLTNIHVPHKTSVGYTYWLNCSYDLERNQLYSIKWYKDDDEIYRFLPSSNPSKAKYDVLGLNIDLGKSNYGNISLTITDRRSQGDYRCEASAEAPSFQTVKETKTMKVYLNGDQSSSSLHSSHITTSRKLYIYGTSILFTMAFVASYTI